MELPATGYLRVSQIVGCPKRKIPALIPVSRTSWWRGVKDGRYPKSVKLGPGSVGWPVESIRKLITDIAA